ncbi:hypothetical protein GWK47_010495 [Chionoecetes opilio]|uniref:Uncharacterized protein n=1 Tax=Chionoecetes opilio TaxID=41210 RepID=A0A8J4Y2E0_CHIOP|nr:hypothetical protein GWK47_010495 [Chionoecetes opilio]
MEEYGSPFTYDSADLVTMDTKVVMSEKVVESVRTAEELGTTQYQTFIQDRLSGSSECFYNPIHKNSLPLFKSKRRKDYKASNKTKGLKNYVELFSRMYISCQSRDGDLDTFFEHENHPWPPALADNNEMRQTAKSDLMTCLEPLAEETGDGDPRPEIKIIDGAALVHTLDPKKTGAKTFGDYGSMVFLPYITKQLQFMAHHSQSLVYMWTRKHGLTGKELNTLEILVKYCLQVYFKLYYDIKVHHRLEDGPKHILTQLRVMRS